MLRNIRRIGFQDPKCSWCKLHEINRDRRKQQVWGRLKDKLAMCRWVPDGALNFTQRTKTPMSCTTLLLLALPCLVFCWLSSCKVHICNNLLSPGGTGWNPGLFACLVPLASFTLKGYQKLLFIKWPTFLNDVLMPSNVQADNNKKNWGQNLHSV